MTSLAERRKPIDLKFLYKIVKGLLNCAELLNCLTLLSLIAVVLDLQIRFVFHFKELIMHFVFK
jgi:hypothetical protein